MARAFVGLSAKELLMGVYRRISRMDGVGVVAYPEKVEGIESFADGPGSVSYWWQTSEVALIDGRYGVACMSDLSCRFLSTFDIEAYRQEAWWMFGDGDSTAEVVRKILTCSGSKRLYSTRMYGANYPFMDDRLELKGRYVRLFSWQVLRDSMGETALASTPRTFYRDYQDEAFLAPFATGIVAAMADGIVENIRFLAEEQMSYQYF